MPDWSYQTILRPVLFRLGPQTGRALALGAMGWLARVPLGRRVIQLMGHMAPDPRLGVERDGLELPSRVGLGCRLDGHMKATAALADFGFGFLEIGPIRMDAAVDGGACHLDAKREALELDSPLPSITPEAARRTLERFNRADAPRIFARIEPESLEETRAIVETIASVVDALVVPADRLDIVRQAHHGRSALPVIYAAVDVQSWHDASAPTRWEQAVHEGAVAGVMATGGRAHEGALHLGKPEFADGLQLVREIRTAIGPEPTVIGGIGAHSPADALDYLEAGADLVQVDTGLIFAGPGLPKRINEALLYRQLQAEPPHAQSPPPRPASQSWFWAFLMGLSMLVGGVLAMAVAVTRVVLPYDESMAGLTRDQLIQVNSRLLPFMQHDRVTLAGTMLAVGMLYMALAWWGVRHGVHWAYMSIVVSAFAGFFSFFFFLGFGYFDPFHAFVTAILFQFLLLAMHAHLPARREMEPPGLWNDRRWKLSQWGQLLFVIEGAALLAAGLTISKIGMTTVFVPEDLEFMQTSREELVGAHPRLVPLVAHDRATFGGMLLACGLTTLLPALWGFARGQTWLWWSLMMAGTIAYSATMQVHWAVGYHSLKHLLPAMGGLAVLWAGGALSYSYVAGRDPQLEAEWRQRIERP